MTALDSETRKKVFWSQYVLDKYDLSVLLLLTS